ncbi:MAG: hypothetical protein SNJ83_06960, partial [Aggregatilineales bacterium]
LGYITSQQSNDLKGLKEVRNACAHPYFEGNIDEDYNVTAEQARYYLRMVVDYVLAIDALQGDILFKRVAEIVEANDFPSDLGRALIVLSPYIEKVNEGNLRVLVLHTLEKIRGNGETIRSNDRAFLSWKACLQSLERFHEPLFGTVFNDCVEKMGLMSSKTKYLLILSHLSLPIQRVKNNHYALLEEYISSCELTEILKLGNALEELTEKLISLRDRLLTLDVDEFWQVSKYFTKNRQTLIGSYMARIDNKRSAATMIEKLREIVPYIVSLDIFNQIINKSDLYLTSATKQFLKDFFASTNDMNPEERMSLEKNQTIQQILNYDPDDEIPF